MRALLNFGHDWPRHENAAGYGYLHGEAVSLGMRRGALDFRRKAGLALKEAEAVLEVLRDFDLPVKLPEDIRTESLVKSLRKDKKFQAGAIRFVLTKKLGSAFVSKEITESDIRTALQKIRA